MYSSYIAQARVQEYEQIEFLLRNYELSEKAKGSEASGIEFINIKKSRLAYSTLSVLA
jgi:hypothetical protein